MICNLLNSEWFWSQLNLIVVSILAFFIYNQLKSQKNNNLISILNEFQRKWQSKDMRNSRYLVCKNRKKQFIDAHDENVLNFFENLGILTKRKIIDVDLIWENYSYYIERYYIILIKKINKAIKDGDPTIYKNFLSLHKRIIKISKKKISKDYEVSYDNIKRFIKTGKNVAKI